MADTIVEIFARPGTTAVFAASAGGSGTPAASYAATQVAGYLFKITVAEALTGAWYFAAGNAAGDDGFRKVDNLTDTATTFSAADPLAAEIATAARDSILNRVLSGNHDTSGTVGKILQALSGITSLLAILKKMIRSDFTDATAESEIGGNYDDATDSLEAKGTVVAAIKTKTDLLGSGIVTVGAPVADDGSIPIIYQGDDYAGSRKLTFTFNSSGFSITGASSRFEAEPTEGSSFAATGSMTDNNDGTATASIAITSAQSDLLETGPVKWSALNITSGGLRETVAEGSSPLARRKHG